MVYMKVTNTTPFKIIVSTCISLVTFSISENEFCNNYQTVGHHTISYRNN